MTLMKMTMTMTTGGGDLFSNDSNDVPDKGGYRDPDYTHGRNNDPDDNNPGDNSDPDDDYTQSTND